MLDIEGFLWRHFRDVRQYGSPVTDLRVNCPFCETRYGKVDRGYKLHVSLSKETCHCFRCDYGSSWIGLVMDTTGMEYVHALGELYHVPRAKSGEAIKDLISLKSVDGNYIGIGEINLPKGFRPLASTYGHGLAHRARNYLRKRGFNVNHWTRYNLGVCPDMIGRVIIPVEGDFWQARALYSFVHPKYMSPKTEARHYLFNFQALDLYEEVVVCEGAFSAMAVGWNAVALLRSKATDEQIDRLVGSDISKFVVALDADVHDKAVELAHRLSRGGKQVDIWRYAEGDPADGGGHISIKYDLKALVEAKLCG